MYAKSKPRSRLSIDVNDSMEHSYLDDGKIC